ncbi:MAG: response regulator transcription factor [Dehalococcoidia bacterium]|nr:response regulator transcription factor [Dehalococcoidia bacterium]
MTETVITLVIADDNPSVRQGVISLLKKEPDLQIIGEASNGEKAIQLVKKLSPDVLIVDLVMPDINGLVVIRGIAHGSRKTASIVLSAYNYEGYVVEAFRAGARAYVLKDSLDKLADAVRAVNHGQTYLSLPLSPSAIQSYLAKTCDSSPDCHHHLSTLQRELIRMEAVGWTISEIAEQLHLKVQIVEVERANLMQTLGLLDHVQMVEYAVARGIIARGQ